MKAGKSAAERAAKRTIIDLYRGMADLKIVRCIKNSLIMLLPVLLTGAFALFFRALPIPAYQTFLKGFLSGALDTFLGSVYSATFGILSIYMAVSVALNYTQVWMMTKTYSYGIVVTSLICFFLFVGTDESGSFSAASLGSDGVFTAIVCGLSASWLYDRICRKIKYSEHLFTDGADDQFHAMLSSIIPTVLVVLIFAVINLILSKLFHVTGFQMLFTELIGRIFENRTRSQGTMLLFQFLFGIMWLFGIHGNNVLESVAQDIFVPAIAVNQEQLALGLPATEIYSKTFLDVFTMIGGCGTTWCLIIAILLFSRKKSSRSLARLSIAPGLLNINEIMTFGLPVIFNPIFMIPFLFTPMVCTVISSTAIRLGLVPVPVHQVQWTTPILLGGYLATDSVAGSVLQLINLTVGVLIYAPFVRLFDQESSHDARQKLDKLVKILINSEESRKPIELLKLQHDEGTVAKILAQELQDMIGVKPLQIFYQPQHNAEHQCIGAEALLRWRHDVYGMIYPPLIIKLAEEIGKLTELEESVYRTVVENMDRLCAALGENARISVNVTGETIQGEEFENFLTELHEAYPNQCSHLAIEITEQAALLIDDTLIGRLNRIKDMGFELEIDDFSMGSTSIKYLQTNIFSTLKLDGGLSKGVLANPRSREIVASIIKLSHEFGISVLAEYVENEEQRKALEDVDCTMYQGYLYSPAIPLEELEERYKKER